MDFNRSDSWRYHRYLSMPIGIHYPSSNYCTNVPNKELSEATHSSEDIFDDLHLVSDTLRKNLADPHMENSKNSDSTSFYKQTEAKSAPSGGFFSAIFNIITGAFLYRRRTFDRQQYYDCFDNNFDSNMSGHDWQSAKMRYENKNDLSIQSDVRQFDMNREFDSIDTYFDDSVVMQCSVLAGQANLALNTYSDSIKSSVDSFQDALSAEYFTDRNIGQYGIQCKPKVSSVQAPGNVKSLDACGSLNKSGDAKCGDDKKVDEKTNDSNFAYTISVDEVSTSDVSVSGDSSQAIDGSTSDVSTKLTCDIQANILKETDNSANKRTDKQENINFNKNCLTSVNKESTIEMKTPKLLDTQVDAIKNLEISKKPEITEITVQASTKQLDNTQICAKTEIPADVLTQNTTESPNLKMSEKSDKLTVDMKKPDLSHKKQEKSDKLAEVTEISQNADTEVSKSNSISEADNLVEADNFVNGQTDQKDVVSKCEEKLGKLKELLKKQPKHQIGDSPKTEEIPEIIHHDTSFACGTDTDDDFDEVSGKFKSSGKNDSYQIVFTDAVVPKVGSMSDCESEDSFIVFEDDGCFTNGDVFTESDVQTDDDDETSGDDETSDESGDCEPGNISGLSASISKSVSDLTDTSLYDDTGGIPRDEVDNAVKSLGNSVESLGKSVEESGKSVEELGKSVEESGKPVEDLGTDLEVRSSSEQKPKSLLLDAQRRLQRKGQAKKNVRFSDSPPKVHVMRVWLFAARSARAGHWERHAIDRERFQRRIADVEVAISWVLKPQHRSRVMFQRFMPWWHAQRRKEIAEKKKKEEEERVKKEMEEKERVEREVKERFEREIEEKERVGREIERISDEVKVEDGVTKENTVEGNVGKESKAGDSINESIALGSIVKVDCGAKSAVDTQVKGSKVFVKDASKKPAESKYKKAYLKRIKMAK